MPEYSRWKTAAILGVTLLVCLAAVPSVLPAATFDQLPKWAQRKPVLGYDLTGGERWQFEVDAENLRKWQLDELKDSVRTVLRENRLGYQGLTVRDGGVEFQLRDTADLPRALAAFELWVRPLVTQAPTNERYKALVKRVDARPSVWASPNAEPLAPELQLAVSGETIRLIPTDAAFENRLVKTREATAQIVGRRLGELGATYQLRRVGQDRLVIETPVSLERFFQMQF